MEEDLKETEETSSFSLAMGESHGSRCLVTCSVLLCIKNLAKYINILLKKKSEPLRISYSKGSSQS